MSFQEELNKRRTFGIVSHPDAGKTTLTEKLLLFGGLIDHWFDDLVVFYFFNQAGECGCSGGIDVGCSTFRELRSLVAGIEAAARRIAG